MRASLISALGLVAALSLGGCAGTGAGSAPAGSHAGRATASPPGPDPSALVRSIGQGCTWYGGLTISAVAVDRVDADTGSANKAGYRVRVRLVNKTPKTYAAGGMTISLWVGAANRAATGDYRNPLGPGLVNSVVAPGKTITGSYGYQLSRNTASNQVSVGIEPSPVDQQCLLRGTARQSSTPPARQ
jgi:hypothetical protein